jgi:CheY-like chemotaxis protein
MGIKAEKGNPIQNLEDAGNCGTGWAVVRPKATVMIIDDEKPVTELVRLLLTLEGFNVLEAGSEPEALEMANGFRGVIDLLLADVRLKVGSGPGAARRIASRFPKLKTVYMSGYSHADLIRLGILAEEDLFLPKPFDVSAFRAVIREGFAKEAQWSNVR